MSPPLDSPAAPARRLRPLEITPVGRSVATATVASYVAGVALGYGQLMVLAAAGILALAAAAVFVAWRPRVQVTHEFRPGSVTAGAAAAAVLTVTNLPDGPHLQSASPTGSAGKTSNCPSGCWPRAGPLWSATPCRPSAGAG